MYKNKILMKINLMSQNKIVKFKQNNNNYKKSVAKFKLLKNKFNKFYLNQIPMKLSNQMTNLKIKTYQAIKLIKIFI